jgi:hypothetical protein
MPAADARFPLNTAQARNLRNWAAGDLPVKTLPVVITLARLATVATVAGALDELARRHEALRSRMVQDSDGALWQVISAAPVELPCETLDIEAASDAWTRVRMSPYDRSAQVTLYLRDGAVAMVRLTVSHVFTDALGTQVLARELHRLIEGRPPPAARPPQPSSFAHDAADASVRRNTEHWRRCLADAPRSCTYSGARRAEYEDVQVVTQRLADADVARVTSGCRQLRVTPAALWAAATNVLVSGITGQQQQVFRATSANRFTRARLGAVAQLAQAIYVPVAGTELDTLRDRVDRISRLLWSAYAKGSYDVNAVLDDLNRPAVARGAVFQPAFELNYLPRPRGDDPMYRPMPLGTIEVPVRVDPPSAKADLAIVVAHTPDPVVQLSARRPVRGQRDGAALIEDLLRVVRLICARPDHPVAAIPVEPFPAVGSLLPGHHSGVAIDPASTRGLIGSVPGVHPGHLEITADGRLLAHVCVDRPLGTDALRATLRERQPWWSGSVVPDDVAQNLTHTTEASS